MASQEVHEWNLSRKGRTGSLTKNRRKKRGMKSRLSGKGIIPSGSPVLQKPRTERATASLLDWGYANH
jgi:hypothetical protein